MLSLDEAVEVSKSICNSDPRAALLTLMPQLHPSIAQTTVIEKKRSLEDKLLGRLGRIEMMISSCGFWRMLKVNDVSIHYTDSGHGGDRRKKSQNGRPSLRPCSD